MTNTHQRGYIYCPYCTTKLESKEVDGKERLFCPGCEWIHFEDPKVAAGVLLLDNNKVLLVRRIFEPNRGEWTLPAGFVDAHENPRDAATRECLEETGLQVEITGIYDLISGREHERGADLVIVYNAKVVGGILRAGDDADEAAFFSLNELPPLAFQATKQVVQSLLKHN